MCDALCVTKIEVGFSNGQSRSYRIVNKLGKGVQSEVFRVRDGHGREFALKICQVGSNREQNVYEDLMATKHNSRYAIMNDLNCEEPRKVPMLPRVYAFGTTYYMGSQRAVTIMTLETPLPFERWNLSEKLKEMGRQPSRLWRTIIILAHQKMSRLEWLHDADFIHCDAHIENWMFSASTRPESALMIDLGFTCPKLKAPARHSRANDLHKVLDSLVQLALASKEAAPEGASSPLDGMALTRYLPTYQRTVFLKCYAHVRSLGRKRPNYDKLRGIWEKAFEDGNFQTKGPLIYGFALAPAFKMLE